MQEKERVLQKADELFRRYGIKSVGMDEISRQAGMSKKTVYRFFPSKEQLILDVLELTLGANHREMEEICSSSANAVEEILLLMKHLDSLFSKLNPVVFYDLQKYYPECWSSLRNFIDNTTVGLIRANLQKGVSEQLYRNDFDINIMSRFRIVQILTALDPVYFSTDQFSLQKVHLTLLDHFLHGIVTLKGHKLINEYKRVREDE